MTFKELILEIEGEQFRFERQNELHAHFTASIISANRSKGQRATKGTDLYNPNPPEPVSLEERKKSFDRAVEMMGPDAIPVRKRA